MSSPAITARNNTTLSRVLSTAVRLGKTLPADNTVQTDDEFWSSTGSGSRGADDELLYQLVCPLARISYVSVAVYRAQQQHGERLGQRRR